MEIQLNWTTNTEHETNQNLTIKQFLEDQYPYLKQFISNQDYHVTINNQNFEDLNIKLSEAISNYKSETINILIYNSILKSYEQLLLSNEALKQKVINVKTENESIQDDLKAKITEEKLIKKFRLLTKDLETDNLVQKIFVKLIKICKINDPLFNDSENEISEVNTRVVFSTPYYQRILDICLSEVYEFIYKYFYAVITDQKLIGDLTNAFISNYHNLVEKINAVIKTRYTPPENKKNLVEQFYNQIKTEMTLQKIMKYTDGKPPSEIYMKNEEPIRVNFSESEYREVKLLLTQFPTLGIMIASNPDMTQLEAVFHGMSMVLKRDISIYNFYGIRMQEFVNGILLYDN